MTIKKNNHSENLSLLKKFVEIMNKIIYLSLNMNIKTLK